MKVTVSFFMFSALAGKSEDEIELPEGAAVADLAGTLRREYPCLFPPAERAIYLVNGRSGTKETCLKDGDRVLMLQILGGG